MGLGNEYESIVETDTESEIKNHLKEGIQKVSFKYWSRYFHCYDVSAMTTRASLHSKQYCTVQYNISLICRISVTREHKQDD